MSATVLPWHRPVVEDLVARRATLPHALLIHGREGTGLVELARGIAQSLLCESGQGGTACGACPACGWFRDGNHPDFREVRPESLDEEDASPADSDAPEGKEEKKSLFIKIDQIRALADFMMLTTHRDGLRILVLHPAESMKSEAANALLKTLEEPPPRTLILLVTSRVGRLLATIRSRCQKLAAPRPAPDVALSWLRAQGVGQPELALAAAGGAPLDAVAFAAPEYQAARSAFVRVLADPRGDMLACAQAHEKADLTQPLLWLHTWVHDLMLGLHALPPAYFPDQSAALSRIAGSANARAVCRFETSLREARRLVHHPLNPRLFLEQLLISYAAAIEPVSPAKRP
ncbi:MAG: DNA polymerase III subunit delta' [Betaproteobacteria bacterium]|nr:DNA polymerase III subunit delta' [Betaproteobacteria bacterium]